MADLETQLAAGDPAAFEAAASEAGRAALLALDAFPAGCVDPARGHEVLCLLDRLALGEEKDPAVLTHLGACPACAAEVADARVALGELELTREEPSDAGRPAISVGLRCTYCHDGLVRPEAAFCSACLAPHHTECWQTHGQCSALGCAETRWVVSSEPPRPARPLGLLTLLLGAGAAALGAAAFSFDRGRGPGAAAPVPARPQPPAAPASPSEPQSPTWVLATRAERELAREAVSRGDLFSALERFDTYRAAAERYGARAQAAAERARAEGLLALGEQEEALLSAERAQALAPSAEGAVILAEVAVIRAGAEQEALAQAALVAAREAQDPTLEARAHLSLAEVYGAREALPLALEHAQRSEELAPTPRARLVRAQVELAPYFEGQYIDRAERRIAEVLREEPGSRWARALGVEVICQLFDDRSDRPLTAARGVVERDEGAPWAAALLARELQRRAQRTPAPPAKPITLARARTLLVDPRHPAGKAYAAALREELQATHASGAARREGQAAARRLYRRALWLCPPHAPALVGLARLSLDDEVQRELSVRALRHDPNSPLALALAARATRDWGALNLAREASGEEGLELALLAAELETLDAPPEQRLARAQQLFGQVRERWPDEAAVFAGELRTLRRIGAERVAAERFYWKDEAPQPSPSPSPSETGSRGEGGTIQIDPPSLRLDAAPPSDPAARKRYDEAKAKWERELLAPLTRRMTEVSQAGSQLEQSLGERRGQVAELLADEVSDPLLALERAQRAASLLPRDAASWARLARAMAAAGDPAGALAASLRAALLEPRRAGEVLPYLSAASQVALTDLQERARAQGRDPRLERLLPWAHAACSRNNRGPVAASRLEALTHERADALLAHVLLGALALHHARYDQAERHLAHVAWVLPAAGEVHYLWAQAAEGLEDPQRVVQALRRARAAGLSVTARALLEGRFATLRRGPLWRWVRHK